MEGPVKTTAKPASGHDIRRVLGPVDDEVVVAVRGTGASLVEVAQAFEWLNADDFMSHSLHHTMNLKIRQVYEILHADRDRIGMEDRSH